MGSGTSVAKGKNAKDSTAAGAFSSDDEDTNPFLQTDPITGALGDGRRSLLRRRRLLFNSKDPSDFEKSDPKDQFAKIPRDDDPVFKRFGNLTLANRIRSKAEGIQYDPGWFEDNVIQHLELDLDSKGLLTQRLFKVAQVSHIENRKSGKQGGFQMSCYEFMALYSLLHFGTPEELLELVFCVFDNDGDDKISQEDLVISIDAFLELQQAAGGLVGNEFAEFRELDEKARHEEARKVAQQAILKFGEIPTAAADLEEESRVLASFGPNNPAQDDTPTGEAGANSENSETDSMQASGGFEASKSKSCFPWRRGQDKAQGADTGANKGKKGRSWNKKKAKEDDAASHSSGNSGSDSDREREDEKAPLKGRPAGEVDNVSKRPPAAKKAKSRGGLCGGGNKPKQQRPSLNFAQWRKWMQETELLPEALRDEAEPDSWPSGEDAMRRPGPPPQSTQQHVLRNSGSAVTQPLAVASKTPVTSARDDDDDDDVSGIGA